MTTNAWDKLSGTVSSDARWSIPLNEDEFLYVDDTDFDKIARRNDFCFVFAGSAPLIEAWKKWLHAPVLNWAEMPPAAYWTGSTNWEMSVCVVTISDGTLQFEEGWALTYEDQARFSGSGAEHALENWKEEGCAIKAIAAASRQDPLTGGETKYLLFATGTQNLSPISERSLSLDTVHQALRERGYHMDTRTGTITPIAEHQKSNDLLKTIASNAKLVACAPIGSKVEWTEEKYAKLKAILIKGEEDGRL